jgi:hypothetical protein
MALRGSKYLDSSRGRSAQVTGARVNLVGIPKCIPSLRIYGAGADGGCHCDFCVTLLTSARAGNRRFWLLSALRAHTKAPSKTDLHRETLRALKRPGGPGQYVRPEPGSTFRRGRWSQSDAPCMFCMENH